MAQEEGEQIASQLSEISQLRSQVDFLKGELDSMRSELESCRQLAERANDPHGYDVKKAKDEYERRVEEASRNVAPVTGAEEAMNFQLQNLPSYKEMKQRHEKNLERITSPEAKKLEDQRFEREVKELVARNRDFFKSVQEAAADFELKKYEKELADAKEERDRKLRELGERIDDVEDDVGADTSVDDGMSDDPDPDAHNGLGEISVDSVVLNGSAGRRKDESIEFVSGEIGVLRLFGWSAAGTAQDGEYDVLGATSSDPQDDGIRFLVRIPQVGGNGAKLGYVRLVRYNTSTCDDGSDSD